ncbi:MAG TPA: hypothetical protein VNT54_19425, partial [Solirubrobacteraceae bacterium]|nr:hypothetical protein [Solirubrobacteraceae bacterium]
DMISAGLFGLLGAIERFDPADAPRFAAFCTGTCAKGRRGCGSMRHRPSLGSGQTDGEDSQMHQATDLYTRVSNIRDEAFQLIQELSHAAEQENADPVRTLALVRMQAVANSLGRIQGDLRAKRFEPAQVLDL